MLLQFSIKNFRTFKDKATLSLLASNYDKDTLEAENIHVAEKFGHRLLRSAVIYGANASGKSKLIEAFAFMRHFVINSAIGSQKGAEIGVVPFLLSSETEKEPSEFEVVFMHKNVQYRYGFEANRKEVVAEWFYAKSQMKEVELFYRDKQEFELHERNFSKGKTIVKEKFVRDNALLLSVAAQFNDETAIKAIEWFNNLKVISGLNETNYQGFTMSQTNNPSFKKGILELLKAADTGIQDILLQKINPEELPDSLPKEIRDKMIRDLKDGNTEIIADVLTKHRKYDADKNPTGFVDFSMDDDESSGTWKFFALSGPILDVLENGYTLVVDELDSKLHPNLVCKIVSLFNSKTTNPKNAQLIFNTHDTNLLDSGLFRRDQIWFTEKNKYGEAKLYSLADFKAVRKTEQFENNYIRGKYGAVPYLGMFDSFTQMRSVHENEG